MTSALRGRPELAAVRSCADYRIIGPPGLHRGLPSPAVTFILTWDEPLHLRGADGESSYRGLLGGLHLRPETVVHRGYSAGIQLGLDPLGFRRLFGLPAGCVAGVNVESADVLGPEVECLREELSTASTAPARRAAVQRFLNHRAGRAERVPPTGWGELTHAWHRLSAANGASVRAVAAEVGWSERHLRNRLQAEVGLSPKEIARVARFHRARRRLFAPGGASGGDLSLAGVAAWAGYFDQAHMSRDFRALAGCPPARLLEEFRFVQAGAGRTENDARHDC